MATSGDYVLEKTANQIIESALRRACIIPVEQSIDDVDRETAAEALNNMIKRWQARGFNLWKQFEYTLPLEKAKQSYAIGPTGDRCAFSDDFVFDKLTADASVSDTTVQVADTSLYDGAENTLSFDPTDEVAGWTTTDATLATVATGLQLTSTVPASEGNTEYEFTDLEVGTRYFFEVNVDALGIDNVRLEVYDVGTSTTLNTSLVVSATGTVVVDFTPTQTTVNFRYVNEDLTGAQVSEFSELLLKQTESGDEIGFFIDKTLREWNFVKRVLDATTLELANAMANDASANNSIYAFSERPPRPLKNDNYRSRRTSDTAEIPVNIWSRKEYLGQVIKDSEGAVTQAYYQPTLTNGRLYVWQVSDTTDQVVIFSANIPIEVFNDALDEPDFPAEWFDALSWNLASEIGPEYGIPTNRQAVIDQKAAITLGEPEDWDEESGSLYIGLSNDVKN